MIFIILELKSNLVSLIFDKSENHYIYKPLSKLNSYVYHSKFYENILITHKHYSTNLAISSTVGHDEPYYILTNGNPRRAIKDYSKRFGSIEFVFKAQKTNGFFLEETQIDNLYAFNSLYNCVCIAQILATILGGDYSKNGKRYKNIVKLITTKLVNNKRIRIYSYFHVGLKIIKYVLHSFSDLNLFKKLILYDI